MKSMFLSEPTCQFPVCGCDDMDCCEVKRKMQAQIKATKLKDLRQMIYAEETPRLKWEFFGALFLFPLMLMGITFLAIPFCEFIYNLIR